jgi:hypothetical protein
MRKIYNSFLCSFFSLLMTFQLFSFTIFRLRVFLTKLSQETCRMYQIRYFLFYCYTLTHLNVRINLTKR